MAPKYKMTYFPARARAEIPRLVFAAREVDYQLEEITMEEWPDFKHETPYGALPMLETDGEKHGQSMAISVFLANLMGDSSNDAFLIEQLLHLREDLLMEEDKHFFEADPAKKLTLADLVLLGALTSPLMNCPKVAAPFPELLSHRERISEIGGIKQLMDNLPDTPI